MDKAFEAVVVGSGFGGTILALSFANKFDKENVENNANKKVCILERGQWWLSHELDYTPKAIRKASPNMREFLEDSGRPYHFWAHHDSPAGVLELLSSSRTLRKTGLYDYKVLGNVHAIVASGVGGGSLIYSNVTLEPPKSVYNNWPTQKMGKKIEEYFDLVKKFLVLNRIPTTSGLSMNLLDKTKAFQEACQALIDEGNIDIVNTKIKDGRIIGDFDLDLSITDIPSNLIGNLPPNEEKLKRLLDKQENVCQRQGRCVLGCIPGARHSFDQILFAAINPKPPSKPKPLVLKELCEVYDIEFREEEEYKYLIKYFQYDPETEDKHIKSIIARYLIVAAGSLGSTELLLKCKERGNLKLSDSLGKRFFTNSDILGFMTLEHRRIDVTRGPVNTSRVSFKTKDLDFAYTIEDTTIAKMAAPAFATFFDIIAHGPRESNIGGLDKLVRDLSPILRFGILDIFLNGLSVASLIRLFTILYNDPLIRRVLVEIQKTGTSSDESTRKFMENILSWVTTNSKDPQATPEERMSRFYAFSGMGRGEIPGILRLKPGWRNQEANNDPGEKIVVEWSSADNNSAMKDIVAGMKMLATEIDAGGSKRVYTPTWDFDRPENSTAVILHPLGGCSMGNNFEDGVVNSYGQVFWNDGPSNKFRVYPDFFVIDGSILPDPPGVNPSMIIAAIAYRAAEKIVGAENLPIT